MLKKGIIWFEKYYLISLLIAVLIAIFIFYMSSQSFEKGAGPEFPYKSIIYHFLIFFILAFSLSIFFIRGKSRNEYWIFIAILLSMAYAISDELHQLFVPNRYCDINDVLIDSAGIMLSGIIYVFRMRKK